MERARRVRLGWLATGLLVAIVPAAGAPQPPGGAVHRERGQGLEVRFVAYPWRPDIFAAFEEGRSPIPPSWAFAHLVLQGTFLLADRRLYPGHYAMVLVPKTGTLPMTLELRRIDSRDFFDNPSVMPAPPGGETVYKAPATFAPASEPSPALDLTVASYGNEGAVLSVRYGNRRLAVELARATP